MSTRSGRPQGAACAGRGDGGGASTRPRSSSARTTPHGSHRTASQRPSISVAVAVVIEVELVDAAVAVVEAAHLELRRAHHLVWRSPRTRAADGDSSQPPNDSPSAEQVWLPQNVQIRRDADALAARDADVAAARAIRVAAADAVAVCRRRGRGWPAGSRRSAPSQSSSVPLQVSGCGWHAGGPVGDRHRVRSPVHREVHPHVGGRVRRQVGGRVRR